MIIPEEKEDARHRGKKGDSDKIFDDGWMIKLWMIIIPLDVFADKMKLM